ncbi:MAG: DNA polymerase II [Candidatus Bathyarchaeota archaeon]|nr:DNA polymerase II [Candidatus Bathyarchaeota archaeon]
MKQTFWLLDINSKITEDTAEVWLWGITPEGKRVLIIDRDFVAYFYCVVTESFDASKLAGQISSGFAESVVKTEVVSRRFFGQPVMAIKVYCKSPRSIDGVSKQLRDFEGIKECFEDDIRTGMRYLLDNSVVPCTWHEAEVQEEPNVQTARVDTVYAAQSPPKQLNRLDAPALRVLAFSMMCYSCEGSPKASRNPVFMISTVNSEGKENQFIVGEDKNDASVLEEFSSYVQIYDPDVIVSYGANSKDWNYLKSRCKKQGLKLELGRAGGEPYTSMYGHVSLSGIVNVDLEDFGDIFPEVKVKTLQNLADHLGVKSQEASINDVEFAAYWDDPKKRENLKRFNLDNSRRVLGIANLLLDFAMQLSSLVSLPLDQVMSAAVGFRVEWFLIKQTRILGELIPRKMEQIYLPYTGGLVFDPKPGLHQDIAVLDFKSMYPNIMITYNLSPDTYIPPEQQVPESSVYEAPEVKHRFRKEPAGFYKEALTYLISVRGQIRKEMKTLQPQTVEYNILDARQKAVKIVTNAVYGYAGWTGARWYIKPVAEAASAWGRFIIQSAAQMAEEKGLERIYGDTDSLFLSYKPQVIEALTEQIRQKYGLEVEVGEKYKRVFFTEAKKRYAGLRGDGSLDIVGLEVIRGDWAEVAKLVQEKVLEIILKDQSPKSAVNYVHVVIRQLRQRQIPLQNLIIWKTLTKPPQKYNIKAPHVEAAKQLIEHGWRLTSGDKVGYVILQGKGRLYSRVMPYVYAKLDDVDGDYYVEHQVVPAAARILAFFGVTEEQLLKDQETEKLEKKSLMDFMGA